MPEVQVSATLQDYLETILQLSQGSGGARVSDIAAMLQNSKPTVTQAIGVLRSMQLVSQEKYGPVRLTSKGANQAKRVLARHETLRRFLVDTLGVSPAVAEADACSIEHAISEETYQRLIAFLEKRKTPMTPLRGS